MPKPSELAWFCPVRSGYRRATARQRAAIEAEIIGRIESMAFPWTRDEDSLVGYLSFRMADALMTLLELEAGEVYVHAQAL